MSDVRPGLPERTTFEPAEWGEPGQAIRVRGRSQQKVSRNATTPFVWVTNPGSHLHPMVMWITFS